MTDEIRGQIEQVTMSNDKGSAHRHERSHSRGERKSKAYNQISSESYLGKAFKQVKMSVGKKALKQTHFEDPSDSSSSSSERSPNDNSTSDEMTNKSGDNSMLLESISDRESDSDPDSSDSSSTSSSESKNYPQQRKGHKCHKQKRKNKKEPKFLLKPITPKKYDGSPDAQIFHRFITEATDYVVDGKVPKDRHVSIISNFLAKKAYTFYTQEVSLGPKKGTLDKFFTELFNYCFPPNFRSIQHCHLENCRQGN
jgi:hypothetical protein